MIFKQTTIEDLMYVAVCTCGQSYGGERPLCPIHDPLPESTMTVTASTTPLIFSKQIGRQSLKDFTPTELKNDAIKRVLEHADEDVKNRILLTLQRLCQSQAFLSADDLEEAISRQGITMREPRLLGAIFKQGAKRGWCRKTDRVMPSKRSVCHGREIAVWQSSLFPNIL